MIDETRNENTTGIGCGMEKGPPQGGPFPKRDLNVQP